MSQCVTLCGILVFDGSLCYSIGKVSLCVKVLLPRKQQWFPVWMRPEWCRTPTKKNTGCYFKQHSMRVSNHPIASPFQQCTACSTSLSFKPWSQNGRRRSWTVPLKLMRKQHRVWEHSDLSQVSRNVITHTFRKWLSETVTMQVKWREQSIGANSISNTSAFKTYTHTGVKKVDGPRPAAGMFSEASLAISSFLKWYNLHPFPFSTSYWTLVLQNHLANRNSSQTITSCQEPYQNCQTCIVLFQHHY